MAKLNKIAFKKAIALTVGYIIFMVITKLWVKDTEIIQTISGVLVSSVLVGILFYFVFSRQHKRVDENQSNQ